MEPLQVAEEVVESSPNKLEDIYRLLAEGSFPPAFCSVRRKNLRRYARKFILEGGCLYYVGPKKEEKREVVVDPEKRRHIFVESHLAESGHHLGQKKTVNRIQRQYYWLGVVKDVVDWIKVCDICQNAEYHKYPCKKIKAVKVDSPWEVLGLTFHGPFPASFQNNSFVIMVTDFFTKWPEAMAAPRNDAAAVAKVLASIYYRFGASKNIYSNQSWNFCEEVSKLLWEKWSITQAVSAADSCEHNGLDDQSYDMLKSSIRRAVNDHPEDWDEHLDPILFQFRKTINPVTKYTPFFLMFNRNVHPVTSNENVEDLIASPRNNDLTHYVYAVEQQRTLVKQMVLSNLSDAEVPVKKVIQKCGRNILPTTFQDQEEVFGRSTEQAFKKIKPNHDVSIKYETALSQHSSMAAVEKDN